MGNVPTAIWPGRGCDATDIGFAGGAPKGMGKKAKDNKTYDGNGTMYVTVKTGLVLTSQPRMLRAAGM